METKPEGKNKLSMTMTGNTLKQQKSKQIKLFQLELHLKCTF